MCRALSCESAPKRQEKWVSLIRRPKAVQGKRDECVIVHGPEAEQCQKLIEAHKICLRAEGFKVRYILPSSAVHFIAVRGTGI